MSISIDDVQFSGAGKRGYYLRQAFIYAVKEKNNREKPPQKIQAELKTFEPDNRLDAA